MVDPIVPVEVTPMSAFQRHKFWLLVGSTIAISLVMVTLALVLYATSGTEQLDLSRPGFKSISQKAATKKDFETFSGSGPLDKNVADEFTRLYDNESSKVTKASGFSGDPIGATIITPTQGADSAPAQ